MGPRGWIVGMRVHLRAQIGVTLAFRVKVLCGHSLSRFVSIVFCDHVPTLYELVFIVATNQFALRQLVLWVGGEPWKTSGLILRGAARSRPPGGTKMCVEGNGEPDTSRV